MFLLRKHIHTRTHSPVSLSRTLLIIWIAFLFRASGFTKPSPTGIHKSRKIAVRSDHHNRPKGCPCFPQIFTFVSVEQFFLYLLSSEYNEKFTEPFLLKGCFVCSPLRVQHSCYFLKQPLIGAIPQRLDLLKEWIDSGTVVPVFLWAGSPSSTPSKISRGKIIN